MYKNMFKWLIGALVSTGLVFTGPSAHSIDENNILVHWSFDELDNEMFKDETGNGYDAELVAPGELVEGKFNQAVHLPGGFVKLAPSDVVQSVGDTGEITMEAWVFFNELPPAQWDGVISDSTAQFRMMVQAPDHNPYWNVGNRADKSDKAFKFKKNRWYHYVALGDTKNSKVYIDGELVAEAAQPANLDKNLPKPPDVDKPFQMPKLKQVSIFVGAGEAEHVWRIDDAIIDEVAIYSKALTEEEINDLTERGLGEVLRSVNPQGKLASRWGEIKMKRH